MRLNPRPSKIFFYNRLENELKKRPGGIGVDAASAGKKFSDMFKTDFYYGLDVNINILKEAFVGTTDIRKWGILADMTRDINKFPPCSIDLLVSTNTLYVFLDEERLSVIKDLVKVVAPGGDMLIEMKKDKNIRLIHEILINNFTSVKKINFKNILSNFYERMFDKAGDIRRNKFSLSKLCLLCAWLLSRFEYATSHFGFFNKHVFFVCSKKRTVCIKNKFDLSRFPIVGGKIFNLMDND